MIRFATVLWHRDRPVGMCVFVVPPVSLALRHRFFGHSGRWTSTSMRVLNSQLVLLQRIVLHPAYRGGGIAAAFLRRSCRLCPFPWIETLSQMGHVNPFFETAGFVRVGVTKSRMQTRENHSVLYGGRRHGKKRVSKETFEKSRFSNPVYYLFDNRSRVDEAAGE